MAIRAFKPSCIASLLVAALCACGLTGNDRGAILQDSSPGSEGLTAVNLNVGGAGVFAPILPRCVVVRAGDTVEFRNFMPQRDARVLGLSGPRLLRSPNLRAPYNTVSELDPFGGGAPCVPGDPGCAETVAHTFWRATLAEAGVYDWVDGAAARHVERIVLADGSAAFVPSDGSLPLGTVCATDAAGEGCRGVCCRLDEDCTAPAVCVPAPADVGGPLGRCLVPVL